MANNTPSNRRKDERPPLLDQEALNTFMAGNPSPEEALNFMFAVVAARTRMESIIAAEDPGDEPDQSK